MSANTIRKNPNRLTGKDLINVRIYSAIYFVVIPADTACRGPLTLRGYRYACRNSPAHAPDIPEITLPTGGVIAVIGRNGAGKSTLAKCLCDLEKNENVVCNSGGEVNARRRMLKKSYMVVQDVHHSSASAWRKNRAWDWAKRTRANRNGSWVPWS